MLALVVPVTYHFVYKYILSVVVDNNPYSIAIKLTLIYIKF